MNEHDDAWWTASESQPPVTKRRRRPSCQSSAAVPCGLCLPFVWTAAAVRWVANKLVSQGRKSTWRPRLMGRTTKTIEKILGFSADYAAERLGELTPREVEVAGKFAEGLNAHQIGEDFGISPRRSTSIA